MQIFIGDWIYTVELEDYTPSKPAYLSGAPEDCYPAEPAELEYKVVSIKLDEGAKDTGGDIESLVNDYEELDELIIAKIIEDANEL